MTASESFTVEQDRRFPELLVEECPEILEDSQIKRIIPRVHGYYGRAI
jgi:hypothetical protein